MSVFRNETVVLVEELRAIWPVGTSESDLDVPKLRRVREIKGEIIRYIDRVGAQHRAVNKYFGNSSVEDASSSKKEMDRQDAIQQFWVGVTNGMTSVKPRLSPDGKIDINDPLEFLISKGKWAVLDYRRAMNSKRLLQICHVCGATHNTFMPDASSVLMISDLPEVVKYKRNLISEKMRRSPIKNVCKECYNDGIRTWDVINPPSQYGTAEFEEDLMAMTFVVPIVNTNMIESVLSGDSNLDDDTAASFIENVAKSLFDDGLYNPYDDIDTKFDINEMRSAMVCSDDPPLIGYVYDVIYDESMEPCAACPHRARLFVDKKMITYAEVRGRASELLCGSKDSVSLGDWDTQYLASSGCGGVPISDCDNMNVRIANATRTTVMDVRNARKTITNRYNAYVIIDKMIYNSIVEENNEKAQRI